MTSYRLFPWTSGPSSPVDFGPGFEFVSGLGFWVTQRSIYFEGYWWWVCPTQQATGSQTFCLWQDTANADGAGEYGALVAASVVTSGPLVAGEWNFVPLPRPIPLTQYVGYRATTASLRYAPSTNGQFGAGGAYNTGIENGPLFAFADASSGNQADVNLFQAGNCTWGQGTLDPTTLYPNNSYQGLNLWIDIQVTDRMPTGSTFRCWPNQPNPLYPPEAALPYTVSTQMAVTEPAKLIKIWMMSQSGNTVLPSVCGIWDSVTQTALPGSVNQSPTWFAEDGSVATAGSGWCYCDYSASGIVLAPDHNYRVAVGMYSSGDVWFSGARGYWLINGGGFASQGIGADHGAGNGIVYCVPCGLPENPLSPCVQDTSGRGWVYPNEVEPDGDNYFVDMEVAPVGGVANSSAFLAFFP